MVVFTCFMRYCHVNNYRLLSFELFLQLNAFINLTGTFSLCFVPEYGTGQNWKTLLHPFQQLSLVSGWAVYQRMYWSGSCYKCVGQLNGLALCHRIGWNWSFYRCIGQLNGLALCQMMYWNGSFYTCVGQLNGLNWLCVRGCTEMGHSTDVLDN